MPCGQNTRRKRTSRRENVDPYSSKAFIIYRAFMPGAAAVAAVIAIAFSLSGEADKDVKGPYGSVVSVSDTYYDFNENTPGEKGPREYPEAKGLLILVNWDNPVPYERPDGLVVLKNIFGDEVLLVNGDGSVNEEAGSAARLMFLDAASEGMGRYKLTSAYRSISYQDGLWETRVSEDPTYGNDPYSDPVKVMPGRLSEHATGLALDILAESYDSADDGYADTPEGRWLFENAYKYGFILRYPKDKEKITGVIYEPWHYRYVGKEAAEKIHSMNICLEEYLGKTHETKE